MSTRKSKAALQSDTQSGEGASFDVKVLGDLSQSGSLEWLETNGLGGWASSTISGAHSRRYHGMLVAAIGGPTARTVLLSRLDETISVRGQSYELATRRYSGAVTPEGFRLLRKFSRELFPVFDYGIGDIVLRKTVAAISGSNTTVIVYELVDGDEPVVLRLRPFVAARDYHSIARANSYIRREAYFADGILCLKTYEGVPECFIKLPGSKFIPGADWYFGFRYLAEAARGLDAEEDLFTHGELERTLRPGECMYVIATTEWPADTDGQELFLKEEARRKAITAAAPVGNAVCRCLVRAADQFVVKRGENLKTLIAGYHWFTDWGRDTMISLPGICLVTGRHDEARQILSTFAQHMSEGMIPNRFPEAAEHPEYNTVDATLWMFVAAYRYYQYTGDISFLRETLYPKLKESVEWHRRGTRYGIRVDSDGLLRAGVPGVQLTWMDAKIGDWVVTPRQGKPVEINALWHNANAIMAEFAALLGDSRSADDFQREAGQIKSVFVKAFWNGEEGYLYDVVDNGFCDRSFRPNQLFALSLPFALLGAQQANKVLEEVEKRLYTPFGLRTIDPADPSYKGSYGGEPRLRDAAYHQGSAWSWLLGPYMTALVRFGGERGRQKAVGFFESFSEHLCRAGVGSVSEIFSGDFPHAPEGCIAQAWGVAEILRAYIEDLCGKFPASKPFVRA